jgi:hypothetical protein
MCVAAIQRIIAIVHYTVAGRKPHHETMLLNFIAA